MSQIQVQLVGFCQGSLSLVTFLCPSPCPETCVQQGHHEKVQSDLLRIGRNCD